MEVTKMAKQENSTEILENINIPNLKDSDFFGNYLYGMIKIKNNNFGLFNADFFHQPRQIISEDKIYSTDKAIKYLIRKYMIEELSRNVFVWRRSKFKTVSTKGESEEKGKDSKKEVKEKGINEDYFSQKQIFDLISKKLGVESKNPCEVLLACSDVRLFGITYTGESNLSFPGPMQISYGIGDCKNKITKDQIMSYFKTGEKPTPTLGEQTRTKEAEYTFFFVFNPKTILNTLKSKGVKKINEKDIDEYKSFTTIRDIKDFVESVRSLSLMTAQSASKNGFFTSEFKMLKSDTPIGNITYQETDFKNPIDLLSDNGFKQLIPEDSKTNKVQE